MYYVQVLMSVDRGGIEWCFALRQDGSRYGFAEFKPAEEMALFYKSVTREPIGRVVQEIQDGAWVVVQRVEVDDIEAVVPRPVHDGAAIVELIAAMRSLSVIRDLSDPESDTAGIIECWSALYSALSEEVPC